MEVLVLKVQTPIMTPPDIEISRAATRLTADTGIVFRPLGGQKFHEREIVDIIREYNTKLKDSLRSSFAPPELLVQNEELDDYCTIVNHINKGKKNHIP